MSVVSEKVGGRRGKELVAPIVMEGGYAAIRRVQEARRKEILQVWLGLVNEVKETWQECWGAEKIPMCISDVDKDEGIGREEKHVREGSGQKNRRFLSSYRTRSTVSQTIGGHTTPHDEPRLPFN